MSGFSDSAGLIWDKAKKWAMYGAFAGIAIGVVALGALSMGILASGPIGWAVGAVLGATAVTANAMGVLIPFILGGIVKCAIVGAVLGAAKEGLVDLSDDLEDKKKTRADEQDIVETKQKSAAIQRSQLLQQGQPQQQTVAQNGVNVSPDGVVGNQRQGQGGVGK